MAGLTTTGVASRGAASCSDDITGSCAFVEDLDTTRCERRLAGGAQGLHFYTMNQAGPSMAIWRRLGLN